MLKLFNHLQNVRKTLALLLPLLLISCGGGGETIVNPQTENQLFKQFL